MLSIDARKKFCEKAIRNKEGHAFSLSGRDWVLDEFWKPASRWRIVANDKSNLCESCMPNIWKLTEWRYGWQQELACDECAGSRLEPILVVILNLPRREGKTFNVAAYTISEICLRHNRNVLFLATSGEQNKMLFQDNWETPIQKSPLLRKMCSIVGERITVKSTGSQFRYAKTSAANSLAGGGVSLLILDECRGLSPKAALSAIGSTRDQSRKECPNGHMSVANTDNSPDKCTACDEPLEPMYPLIVMTSSSGIETGSDLDWFQNIVDAQTGVAEGVPVASVHTFRMQESSNPAVQSRVTNAYDALFSQSDILRPYVDVEMHNTPRRIGEDFVSPAAIKAVTDRKLRTVRGSEERCVAFLDTSTTGDLTSLVILCEDSARCMEDPFEYVFIARIDRWDPAKQHNGVIDPVEIRRHMLKILPGFPNLITCGVDVRGENSGGNSWASALVKDLHAESSAFRMVREFGNRGSRDRPDRDTGWSLLEQRILSRRVRLPDDPGLFKELRGVQKKMRGDGTFEVRDRNRRQVHADVAEGLATCCLLIHREQSKVARLPLISGGRVSRASRSKGRDADYVGSGALSEKDLI